MLKNMTTDDLKLVQVAFNENLTDVNVRKISRPPGILNLKRQFDGNSDF